MTRTERSLLVAILLLAAAVRIAYLAEARRDPSYRFPAIDAGFNDDWARSIAVPGWQRPSHLPDPELDRRAYLRPPGYPWFLAGTYAVSRGLPEAPRVAQVLLGLASALLAWRIARRAAGPVAGLVAAALLALEWSVVYWEEELHEPAPLAFLLLAAILALQRWSEAPSLRRAVLPGALLGLAALVRPNALFVVLAAAIWMAWVSRGRSGESRSRLLPSLAGLFAASALAIAPATVRNAVVAGEFVPITSNLGVNLYIGNHEGATGFVSGELPGYGEFRTCYDYPAVARRVEREAGRPLSSSEISAVFTHKALDFVRDRPGAFLRLLGRKARLFWGPDVVSHNKVEVLDRETSGLLRRLPRTFSLLVAGALVGLLLALRHPGPERRLAVLAGGAVLGWFLSVLPFFAAERYRAPIVPLLAVLSAVGLAEIVARFRGGRRTEGAGWTAALAVLGLLATRIGYDLPPNVAKWHMDRGRALARDGRPEEALAEFGRAIAADPGSAEPHFSSALALEELGRTDEAVEAYRRAIAARPDHAGALTNLGALLAREGRVVEAIDLFARAARADPEGREGKENLEKVLALAERALERAEAEGRTGLAEALRAAIAEHRP